MIYNFLKKYSVAITFSLLALIISLNLLLSNSMKTRFIGIFFIVLMMITSFSNDYSFNRTSITISSNLKKLFPQL